MYLGRVIGTVVCERKDASLAGMRLLLVQPLDHTQHPSGPPEVAVDTVSSRLHDLVFLVGSREASLACNPTFAPVDSAIVGHVDAVNA